MVSQTALHVPESGASIGLYVHMPWCVRKCPYCDFNSYEMRGSEPGDDYINALLRDLGYEVAERGQFFVSSIYIGGGTPSLFTGAQIHRLLDGIRDTVRLEPSAEITMEANPGALEAARFDDYRAAGVNRVSIGIQSLRDHQLKQLGRVHSAAEAQAAVVAALGAGFDSVNVDLMYGLPGDDVADALDDLARAIALGSPHLSWYQLTLEPNTAWERRPPEALPQDEAVELVERRGRDMLSSAGFERYEVSAYAKTGHRCAHNLNYWRFGDYAGIGAGAHSKRRKPGDRGFERYSRLRNPVSYAQSAGSAAAVEPQESVTDSSTITLEYLMNALRLREGTSLQAFETTTGIDRSVVTRACSLARREGLMSQRDDQLCASARGYAQLNRILRMID